MPASLYDTRRIPCNVRICQIEMIEHSMNIRVMIHVLDYLISHVATPEIRRQIPETCHQDRGDVKFWRPSCV